jgi:hypothetical protein
MRGRSRDPGRARANRGNSARCDLVRQIRGRRDRPNRGLRDRQSHLCRRRIRLPHRHRLSHLRLHRRPSLHHRRPSLHRRRPTHRPSRPKRAPGSPAARQAWNRRLRRAVRFASRPGDVRLRFRSQGRSSRVPSKPPLVLSIPSPAKSETQRRMVAIASHRPRPQNGWPSSLFPCRLFCAVC